MREKRLFEIKDYLTKHKMCSFDVLCEIFDVSKNTIRRDIQELVDNGYVNKVHGGIVLRESYNNSYGSIANRKRVFENEIIPFSSRVGANNQVKQIIGRLASTLVEAGDTIFIDSGTTSPCILQNLLDISNIHIVSNNMHAINEAKGYGLEIHCLGGVFVPQTDSFIGGIAMLESIRINKAFMGTSLLSTSGLTDFSYYEAEMKKAVISHSNQVIVMADSSKFGKTASICFCQIKDVSVIVTEKRPSDEIVAFANLNSVRLLFE